MGKHFKIASFLLFTAAVAAVARADQLVKADGTTLTGKVVAEQKDTVTFESYAGGMTLRQKIARANIKSLRRDVREGPGYCPLPLVGVIGEGVLARDLEAGVRAARASKPQYVVLVIDSPGGSIAEMASLVQVVRDNPDLKFVAYVKHAISAAAIVAMSCPQIYVAPGAVIGAAVPWKVGPDGTPVAVEAKFQSAIQAEMKNAARLGGHDELWVRGMTELDLALAWDVPAAAPTTAPATAPPPRGTVKIAADASPNATEIKSPGKILTLTAAEAVRYGLAAGAAADVAAVKSNLKLKAWHVSDDNAAWRLMEDRARSARAAIGRQAERVEYVRQAVPELVGMDRRLRQIGNRIREIAQTAEDLKRDEVAELRDLDSQRQVELRRASLQANPHDNMARINDDYAARRQAILDRYKPIARRYLDELRALTAESDRLNDRRKKLVANAPASE
jgi:membrane-bound serine protease (ClpP class)